MPSDEEVLRPGEPDGTVIWAHSIFGAQTRKGLVGITIGDREPVYMSPEEARSVAADILQAATAAETDEVLMRWLAERLGLDDQQGIQVLRDLRKMREERPEAQSQPKHA
jgi:hypothetical protein